eukprot:scpid28956/ scgid2452/ 
MADTSEDIYHSSRHPVPAGNTHAPQTTLDSDNGYRAAAPYDRPVQRVPQHGYSEVPLGSPHQQQHQQQPLRNPVSHVTQYGLSYQGGGRHDYQGAPAAHTRFIKQASDRSSVSGGDGAVMASHGRDDGTASLPPPGSSSLQEDLYSTGTFQSHQLYGDGRPRTTASSSSGSSSSDGRHHVPSVLSSSYDASGYRALDHARQQYQPAGTAPAASHLPRDQYGAFPHSRNISVQAYRSGEKGTAHDVPVAQQRYTQWPASVQEPLVVERAAGHSAPSHDSNPGAHVFSSEGQCSYQGASGSGSGGPAVHTSQSQTAPRPAVTLGDDVEERRRRLDDEEETVKQHRQMLKDERSELDALRLRLHERARDLEEREAGVDRRGEEIAKTNASFGVRQAEFAAQKKEHEELLATDIRLEKEIAKARQRRDDIKQEVTSLETRKSDLLEEITSQGRILCDLEEKNQKLRGQGTATVDEALTGLVPTRSTLAQPAHGPNSARPPTSQRSPLHGTSAIGAMSHSPHSSPASKPKPPSGAGAYMASAGAGVGAQTYNYLPANLQAMYASGEQWDTMSPKARDDYIAAQLRAHQSLEEEKESELVALQLQQEEQEEATRRGALTAESLARKELEDRERLKREKNDRELRDFQMAQQLEEDERRKNRQEEEQKAKQRQEHQRREQQRQEQQRQESEQVAVRESQENALPDISLPSEPESIDAIRSRLSRIQPS